ncbi:fibronectin type III domain-containing protein [Bifidobacterium felsineum]|uniref:fibronectin type III domain-containing protein n=1 Tax=Bifidobacterium felsineum TaxID=2045440 RepID=UPI001BDCA36C|nr:fibronectin type III domain-containing protein [Bifidobacterium felsineum]MBT1164293.1 tandem-95 repeat protein [Bifidobacterium felsineum]
MAHSSHAHNRRRLNAITRRMPLFRQHTWLAPMLTLLALLALVAGAVIISSVTRQHVQLDDGTVWVTSFSHQKAARFNVKNQEADAGVSSSAPQFDIAQHNGNTILTEPGQATSIKASTVSTDEKTDVKANTLALNGGDTLAFINEQTGNVWAGPADQLDDLTPTTTAPQMKLGSGGRIAVTHEGTVYGYRPSDGMVLMLQELNSSNPQELTSLSNGKQQTADSFTVIGDTPVITSGNTVIFNNRRITIDTVGTLMLQAPSTDGRQTTWVAAASPRGVAAVELKSDGKARFLATEGTGDPAQPVSLNGCVYAAWSQKARNYIRICGADASDDDFKTLESVNATSQLVFRTNHRLVVLNDVVNGNVWNPNSNTKVIKIQWNTIQTDHNTQDQSTNDSANNHRDFSKTCSAQSGQIQAENDQIGARAGSEQILDVLHNDEQTDCSVLTITKVSAVSGASITVSSIYDGRYLQMDASATSTGTATFSYDISDGRGQTSTAMVTVTLSDQGNHAPEQSDTPPEINVEQGASYTANALGSFTDPDGDPLTLISAAAQNSDQVQVSTRADGQLTFNTGAQAAGRVSVEVTVSDGEATGTGILYFSVKSANTLPAVIDPVTKATTPNTDTVIDLAPYVHGTSTRPAQLSQVDTPNGAVTTSNAADMSISFKASNPGTYYVPYTITQGPIPATGLARVEVLPVTGESAKPVAANDVALLGADNTAIVEPLANDVDPMGGILSVTTVSAAADSGIKVGLVSHKRVYITARQIPTRPTPISYTVANAAGTSTGTIVLQPPALAASNSAPKASNINTQVRTGGIVSVDVLNHVDYSDGTTVRLKNNLQYDKSTFKGLAFVSADTVRYQASQETGVFPITYTVEDNLGNVASATITITVHESNAESKAPPTPHNTEAQVAAGQKVRIPITLTGIDTDGDDDQLLGLGNKVPTLGRISEVGSDYLIYEAYPDSSGTDTFSYAVEDWTGQRAQAQIRVGVFQGASDSGVYARDDAITLRPNTAATVPVTQNDISGDDTDLTVSDNIEAQGIEGVSVQDNMIAFTTPPNATTAYIAYTVRDKAGLSDTATLSVNVDPNAPIEPPTAYDYRVPSAATIDKKTVDVDVSQWIANPSGTTDELSVAVHPSAADHARVKEGKHSTIITVDLTAQARAVPYTVTNTTYNITSTAFIQVPAYGVFPPTLRPKAPELKVNARETIQININDYVRVGAGKEPYIESADSVSATKASNADLYVNSTTLKFTADKDYAGPASITFTAVDGKPGSSKTKIINSAVITLQITVVGRDVPPPTFSSPTIDVEAGAEAKTIDLTALTHSPSGLYEDEKQYSYSGGTSSGPITSSLSSSGSLKIAARVDADPGTTASIPIAIKYSKGTVNAGITVRVAVSTRPLARISNKSVTIKAGSTATVNMLADAYNPFPETALSVTNCRTDDTSKLSVTSCGSSGTIVIAAAADIGASSNMVLVDVSDGTKTKEREVTGSITVSVIDKPGTPLLSPIAGDPQNGAVNLSWTPGSANGSPITDYKVQWTGAGTGEKSCGAVTACQITGLTNGNTYSFTVSAKNEVGWSKASNPVSATPDNAPSAPTNVQVQGGNKQATVTWNPPEGDFSAVDNYTVTITGAGAAQSKETGGTNTRATFEFNNNDITDGTTITATVKAHNKANWGPESTASSPQNIWGDPDAPTVTMTNEDTTITVIATANDNRNAGCISIAISGAANADVSCTDGTATFTVPESALNTEEFTVKATVQPKLSADPASTQTQIKPSYSVKPPTNVSTTGNADQCTVQWSKQGRAQSFQVIANGIGTDTVSGNATSYAFTMSPWATCSGASVMQTFNGTSSTPATGGPETGKPYVYEVPVDITAPDELRWANNEQVINVSGGSVNTYGKDATIQIIINDKPFIWIPGRPLDVTGLPRADTYTWSVAVTGNNGLHALDNTAQGGTVQGSRPGDTSTAPMSLRASSQVRTLAEHPWILGLANTPQ